MATASHDNGMASLVLRGALQGIKANLVKNGRLKKSDNVCAYLKPMYHVTCTDEQVVSREEQGQNEVFMLNGHEEQEGVNKFEEKDGNSKNYDESDATVDRHRKILHTDNLKLQDEYQRLQQQNNKLQLLLAEYFQRKKCESRFSDECTDEEKERCYHNTLAKLKELQEECVDQKVHFEDQLKKLQEERQKTEDMIETELEIFVVYKREIILQAMKRHGGKRVSLEDLERLQQVEERREKELARVQLENIKLNMRFSKYQEKFKTHSIGVDGQHLIDYEELKMENHTYNEKIEEQKEALQKVKKKISSTTHTLTQVKEKQEFIKAENLVKMGRLMKLEAHVNEKKEALKKLKQSRDSLWLDVKCLRCKSGLLRNVDLLQDFEDHSDSNDALQEKLDYLKMRYVQLTQNCREFRRKVQYYAKQT